MSFNLLKKKTKKKQTENLQQQKITCYPLVKYGTYWSFKVTLWKKLMAGFSQFYCKLK